MFCTVCAATNPIAAARCSTCGTGLASAIRGPLGDSSSARVGARRRRWRGADAPATSSMRRSVLRLLYLVPVLALLAGGASAAARYRADRANLVERYAEAAAAAAAGRHPEAASLFADVAGYRDADLRRDRAMEALAPYRVGYLDGIAALDGGRYEEAVDLLLPVVRDLPRYEDATARLADARRLWVDGLRRDAAAAATRRDWRGAERALVALVGADPGDRAAVADLEATRREHGPMVVARDLALYLIGPDGADEQLLTDAVPAAWPTWSPDRSRIAFLSPAPPPDGGSAGVGDVALYVVGVDGTGVVRLADRLSSHTAPVWSPDGTRLAYTRYAAVDRSSDPGKIGVRVVEVATGRETDLTTDSPIAFNPTWSPTGDRLAYVAKEEPRGQPGLSNVPGDVQVYSFASGERTTLTDGSFRDAWSLAWSPTEETLLVFTVFGQAWYEPAQTGLRSIDVQTAAVEKIPVETTQPLPPVWSPDGERFAFADGETTVRVRSLAGDEVAIEVAGPLSGEITWSPGGDALVVAPMDPVDPSVLIRLVEGGPTQEDIRLTFDFDSVSSAPPQWAPLRGVPPAGPPSPSGTGPDHKG